MKSRNLINRMDEYLSSDDIIILIQAFQTHNESDACLSQKLGLDLNESWFSVEFLSQFIKNKLISY